MAVIVGNSEKTQYQMNVQKGNNNNIYLGDSAMVKAADKPIKKVMEAAGNIVDSTANVINAPVLWLKDMQSNWLTYLILIAIILVTISFLYCVIRSRCSPSRNTYSIDRIIEVATGIANKKQEIQIPISNTTSNSS